MHCPPSEGVGGRTGKERQVEASGGAMILALWDWPPPQPPSKEGGVVGLRNLNHTHRIAPPPLEGAGGRPNDARITRMAGIQNLTFDL